MTVEVNDTVERYTIGGVGPYPFSFRVFDEDEIAMFVDPGDSDTIDLVLTTHYTVSGVNDSGGGTVTLTSSAATLYSGLTLDIRANTTEYQPTSIRNQGAFLPSLHEDAFDRLSRQFQDLARKVRGAVRYPDDSIDDAAAPKVNSRKGRYLFANAMTGAFEWVTSIVGTVLSQSIFNQFLNDSEPYKRTPTEIDAGVVPVNTLLPEGHVERYATWANSSTDFTTAFQIVSAVVNQRPGLVIQFTPGRTYAAWPANGGTPLFPLSAANGVTFEGNGALIQSAAIVSGLHDVIDMNNCNRICVRNLAFQQGDGTVRGDGTYGAHFFKMRRGTHNVHFENTRMQGGRAMINPLGTVGASTEGPRCFNITNAGMYAHTVYYPQLFQASGDNYSARGVTTINCGRSYFPYNVHTHDVAMYSEQGGPFADVLLKCYGIAGAYSRLQNIKLRYTSLGRFAGSGDQNAGDQLIEIEAQPDAGVTPSFFEDIDVTFDVECGLVDQWAGIFGIRKFTAAGARDAADRGHQFGNIRVGGFVRSAENLLNAKIVDLFTTDGGTAWDGSLDNAWNIAVEKLFVSGTNSKTAVAVADGRVIKGNFALRDVHTTEAISVTGIPQATPVDYTNVTSSNFTTSATYVPTWTSAGTQPVLGNGTLEGAHIISGGRVTATVRVAFGTTTTAGTGAYSFLAPIAADTRVWMGSAGVADAGTNLRTGCSQISASGTQIQGFIDSDTVVIGGANPIVWANGDAIFLTVSYRHSPNF